MEQRVGVGVSCDISGSTDSKIVGPWNIKETHNLYGRIYRRRYNNELLTWLRENIYVNSMYTSIDTKERWVTYIVRNLVRNVASQDYNFLYGEYTIFRMLINFWFGVTLSVYNNKDVVFKRAYHRDRLEDYDKYNRKFGFDYWDNFMNKYEAEGLFDESDVGQKMRLYFSEFVYSILDVITSKSVADEENAIKEADKELQELYEEQNAHFLWFFSELKGSTPISFLLAFKLATFLSNSITEGVLGCICLEAIICSSCSDCLGLSP